MNARRDDDALSWDGDEDPTLDVGRTAPERGHRDAADASTGEREAPEASVSLPEGYIAVGKGSELLDPPTAATGTASAGTTPGPAEAERPPMGNAALLSIGILGGVYLLYVIGWIVGGIRLQGKAQYLVADVMFQGSFWLAVLSPVLWFGTVFLLTTHARPWVRFAWLVGGVVLLVPWPFVMIGVVGQ